MHRKVFGALPIHCYLQTLAIKVQISRCRADNFESIGDSSTTSHRVSP
jgi:hypothetical protein